MPERIWQSLVGIVQRQVGARLRDHALARVGSGGRVLVGRLALHRAGSM